MEQSIAAAGEDPSAVRVSFTPLLAPMPRGIVATCSAPVLPGHDPGAIIRAAYSDEQFVTVLDEGQWPTTGAVLGTNGAQVQVSVDEHAGRVIVVSVIDNLGMERRSSNSECQSHARVSTRRRADSISSGLRHERDHCARVPGAGNSRGHQAIGTARPRDHRQRWTIRCCGGCVHQQPLSCGSGAVVASGHSRRQRSCGDREFWGERTRAPDLKGLLIATPWPSALLPHCRRVAGTSALVTSWCARRV